MTALPLNGMLMRYEGVMVSGEYLYKNAELNDIGNLILPMGGVAVLALILGALLFAYQHKSKGVAEESAQRPYGLALMLVGSVLLAGFSALVLASGFSEGVSSSPDWKPLTGDQKPVYGSIYGGGVVASLVSFVWGLREALKEANVSSTPNPDKKPTTDPFD